MLNSNYYISQFMHFVNQYKYKILGVVFVLNLYNASAEMTYSEENEETNRVMIEQGYKACENVLKNILSEYIVSDKLCENLKKLIPFLSQFSNAYEAREYVLHHPYAGKFFSCVDEVVTELWYHFRDVIPACITHLINQSPFLAGIFDVYKNEIAFIGTYEDEWD